LVPTPSSFKGALASWTRMMTPTSPTRSHWTSLGLDRHERTSTLSFPPSPAAAMKMTSARAESLGARLYVVPRGDRLLLKQKTVQAVRTHF
jgi:hypothetical protein